MTNKFAQPAADYPTPHWSGLIHKYSRFLVPVLLFGLPLIGFLGNSPAKPFWMDEVLTAVEASDASLPHMLNALASQMDGSHPVYPILVWCWARVFGVNEITLRLPSLLAVLASGFVLWRLLIPRTGYWAASFAVGIAYCSDGLFLDHAYEARCYGLLLLLGTLQIATICKIVEDIRTGRCWYAWNALIVGAIALTHLIGLAYCGMLTLFGIVMLLRRHRALDALGLGLTSMLGLCALGIWIGPIMVDMDTSVPEFWISTPTLEALLTILSFDLTGSWLIAVALLLLAISPLLLRARHRASQSTQADGPRSDVLPWLALALYAVCVTIWMISLCWTSMFLPRYLILTGLGMPILAAYLLVFAGRGILLSYEFRSDVRAALAPVALTAGVALLAAGSMDPQLGPEYTSGSRGDLDHALNSRNLPIVCESPHTFLPRVWYYRNDCNYVLPLDWYWASQRSGVQGRTVMYKIMKAFSEHYPEYGQVVKARDFFRRPVPYLLVDEPKLDLDRLWLPSAHYRRRPLASAPHPLVGTHNRLWIAEMLPVSKCSEETTRSEQPSGSASD